MERDYHILNGDALQERFPHEIQGDIIVMRECLIDGPVDVEGIEGLYKVRARFISTNYSCYSEQDEFAHYSEEAYYRDTVSEFEKIGDLPEGANIHLWFEDDLFCQVNFWFVASLLETIKDTNRNVFLVRPKVQTQYGFGGLSQSELLSIYRNKIPLEHLDEIANLWKSYQKEDIKSLLKIANDLKDTHPFILPAVEAHIARLPTENDPGKPLRTLMKIMDELETNEFGLIFTEFCKREYIYGFGDLQVRRLLDELKSNG